VVIVYQMIAIRDANAGRNIAESQFEAMLLSEGWSQRAIGAVLGRRGSHQQMAPRKPEFLRGIFDG
jgi:hypothetical protein